MLQEGVGDHGHQCVTMKTLPGSSLEVIKSEFFFQLLMPCSQIHRALMVAASPARFIRRKLANAETVALRVVAAIKPRQGYARWCP
jgi:hypothetical protein